MNDNSPIRMVFSDVDGTLVHYPESQEIVDGDTILFLPPSSTGMKGIISYKTLRLCSDLRTSGIKLVLVSGMRHTTLMKRLRYLPLADAYCCEAGGRIFYPTKQEEEEGGEEEVAATKVEQKSFRLREDLEWRTVISNDSIIQSFHGNTPLSERTGKLWDFARELEQRGWTVDCQGYTTCFRIQRTNQRKDKEEEFEALPSQAPEGLASSVNLGCVDFYPEKSGKKNCCNYLAHKFLNQFQNPLSRSSVCICDDDNDLEMAMSCKHAYVPSITSRSMEETAKRHPNQITVTCDADVMEIDATEKALELILEEVRKS